MAKAKAKKRKAKKLAPIVKVKSSGVVVQGPADADAVKAAAMIAEEEKRRREEQRTADLATQARLKELGLREVVISDCPYKLLCLIDSQATPTMEQRLVIAKRINDVGSFLPQYIPKGALMKRAIPGVSTAEIEKAFAQNKKDEEQRFAAAAKEAKKKEREAAVKAKAVAAAHKRMKSIDVTPKVKPKPEPVAESKQKAAVKKAPPKKDKTSFEPMKVPSGGFNKTNKPATSGELIRARIMEHKMTDAQIAAEVRKLFEGRNTSETDVRWNRGQMRLRGVKAPDPIDGPPQKAKK